MDNINLVSDAAWKSLGVYLTPKLTAPEWAPMEAGVVAILREQAAGVPWLPAGWLEKVNALIAAHPTQRVTIAPALSTSGKILENTPAWLDTDEKRTAWQAAFDKVKNAISVFASGMQAEGIKLMAEANNRAWWDDNIYRAVKFIADAPGAVVGAAGDFATGMIGTFLKRWWFVGLVVVIGAAAWFNRAALSKALGDRAAKAIKGG